MSSPLSCSTNAQDQKHKRCDATNKCENEPVSPHVRVGLHVNDLPDNSQDTEQGERPPTHCRRTPQSKISSFHARGAKWPNDTPDQPRRASGIRFEIETESRRWLHPVG